MQKKIKSFDGTIINYNVHKAKSSFFLVFLHGAGGDLTAWKKERHFFHKKSFSTMAVDLRGHGLSGRPVLEKQYTLDNFAKDVFLVLKKEKIRNFAIAGHCFGGMVAIKFHELFPNLAKAYILIDTSYKPPKLMKNFFKKNPFFMNLLNKILENKKIIKKSHVNFEKFKDTGDWNFFRIYSDITHTSLKSWLFTYENIANFKGIKILEKIKKPALIIQGKNDTIFRTEIGKKIHKFVKTSKLEIFPNSNHIVVLNNPEILEQSMLSFINSLKTFKNTP
jgi:pimeloyl-ACP methyl ester carboxylesterase